MDTDYTDEQEALRTSVRRLLEDRAPMAFVRAAVEAASGVRVGTETDQVGTVREDAARAWSGLAELGLTGMLVPERYGGLGATLVDLGPALEELGRALYPGPFVSTAVSVPGLVVATGAPDDAAELLHAVASGTSIAAVAVFEPGRRFAIDAPSTTARRSADGWMLSGTKSWVTDGHRADTLVVTATDPDGALGAFAVTATDCAVEAVPGVDATTGWATVRLADTPGHRIGGDATAALHRSLDLTGTALVVDGVGAAQRALDLTVAYALERRQFGVPIGSFQAVQHLCADMLRDLELGRGAGAYALWAADAADTAEFHRAATMAQAWASDAFERVGASAIQVFGGVGFTWEADVHLFYKRLLSLQQSLGSSADHLRELATIVLG